MRIAHNRFLKIQYEEKLCLFVEVLHAQCTQYIVSENVKESDCLHKVDITHFVIISLAYKQHWQLSLIFKCTHKIKKNTQTRVIGDQSRCESHEYYHDFGRRDF